MAITEADKELFLPWVRRLEAAGFRAWPAASVRYDGALSIRLNAGHPAKRLNSINSLDPLDYKDIPRRMNVAERAFDAYGRPVVVRQTPLMPPEVVAYCRQSGWSEFDHSLVMKAPLGALDFSHVVDRVPLQDIGRFVESAIEIGAVSEAQQAGLSEIINAIEPEVGLFVMDVDGQPAACCIAVRDGDIVGLFEVATQKDKQRQGLGRAVVLSALKWAASKGVRNAWLQVVADNEPAVALYQSLGFKALYHYSYWQDLTAKSA